MSLFSNTSQRTSKCGKTISNTQPLLCKPLFYSYTFWHHLWSTVCIMVQVHGKMDLVHSSHPCPCWKKFFTSLEIKEAADIKVSGCAWWFANKSSFMSQEKKAKDIAQRKNVTHTLGILVIPPTNKISPISLFSTPASLRHFLQGSTVLWIRSLTRDSNFARVSFMAKCLGPLASTVM